MFLALCAAESGLLFLLLSIYRSDSKPDLPSFVFSSPGIVFIVSVVIILLSVWWIVSTFKTRGPLKTKYLMMAAGMNVLMLFLLIASVEIVFRSLSKDSEAGEVLFGMVLHPRQWGAIVAQQQAVLDKMAAQGTYLIYDELEGWTIAPSSSDKNGVYFSSLEGLRSPRPDVSFADLRSRHSGRAEQPASVRIALIGDSMTFGYEVRCEESLGHVLESHLQPSAQILNFAVAGYGLNQVFLRYEKEVRPWHPHIVIVGISSAMIRRINNIYPALMNRDRAGGGLPFVRPRLILKDGALTTINYPVPKPQEIPTHSTVRTLPYLDLDDYYIRSDWNRGGMWSLLEGSDIFRVLYSFRPPGDLNYENRREKAVQSSEVVLQYLVRKILDDGSIPLLVYFPYQWELSTKPRNENTLLAARVLHNSGFQFHDPSSCLRDADISAAYAKGGHYSARGNAYIARCLLPAVKAAMN